MTEQWASVFFDFGMVTDAVWTDLNGDGRDDLVVVGEWMAPRVFRKNEKDLEEITGKLDPEQLSGWWNAVHTADLNEDGRPDMVLGNHGLNSQFRASWECPVRMWVENFDGNGIIEQILSTLIPKGNYPIAGPYDASYGVVLGVDEGGQLYSYPPRKAGFGWTEQFGPSARSPQPAGISGWSSHEIITRPQSINLNSNNSEI